MKLSLQPVEFRHMSWLKSLRNNPEIMDFCRQPYLLNDIAQEEWFKGVSKTGSMIPFIVSDSDLKQGEDWIAYCAFSNVDPIARRAECSYFVDPKFRNKGYGVEVIFQLLFHGFYKLGYQKIGSDTFAYNQAEIDLNKSCGFKESGRNIRHYFKRGGLTDSIIMYITREDFDLQYCDRILQLEANYPVSKSL